MVLSIRAKVCEFRSNSAWQRAQINFEQIRSSLVLQEHFARISAISLCLIAAEGASPLDSVSLIPIYYVLLLLCRSRIDIHIKFNFDVKMDDATHTQDILLCTA